MNTGTNAPDWVKRIATDVIEYADKYGCPLHEAMDDWEGDGPGGSFGLSETDRLVVWQEVQVMTADFDGEAVFRSI